MKILCSIFELPFIILYIIFPFFHPYVPFFFFFPLVFSPQHTYTHSLSLSLSFSNSLFFLFSFFFFYLIPEHSLALSMIRNREKGRERKIKEEILLPPPLIKGHRLAENWRSLCQAAPSTPLPLIFLPNTAQMGQMC